MEFSARTTAATTPSDDDLNTLINTSKAPGQFAESYFRAARAPKSVMGS
jgi:hypothetical protein